MIASALFPWKQEHGGVKRHQAGSKPSHLDPKRGSKEMLRKKHCIAAKAIRAPSVLSGFLLNRVSQPVSRKGQLCGKLSIWFRKVFNGCILYFTHTKKKGGGGGIIRQSSYTCIINMYFWNKCCAIDLLTVTPANSLNHIHLVYWALPTVWVG